MEGIKKKQGARSGFSTVEMLIAMLILLMVSAIVAAGIPVARNAYEKVVLTSNAQTLISTAVSALRNELGTAQEVEVDAAKKEVSFYNTNSGSVSRIFLAADDPKAIMFQRYTSSEWTKTDVPEPVPLVSEEASSKSKGDQDLFVTYTSIDDSHLESDGYIVFKGVSVNKTAQPTESFFPLGDLSIRVLAY